MKRREKTTSPVYISLTRSELHKERIDAVGGGQWASASDRGSKS